MLKETRQLVNSLVVSCPCHDGSNATVNLELSEGKVSTLFYSTSGDQGAWEVCVPPEEGLMSLTSLRHMQVSLGAMQLKPGPGFGHMMGGPQYDRGLHIMVLMYSWSVELTFGIFTQSWQDVNLEETLKKE